jgi:DNA repair photolyase
MRSRAILGTGAASDPYIPLELEYRLTRQCLEITAQRRFGISLCTKSNLVLRDIDVLTRINEVYACVQFTITTPRDELAAITEPSAPPPSKRFEAMGILSEAGIEVGITMMPLLPYINESEEDLRMLIRKARQYGASFIVPAFGMTLRDRQRAYYYDKLDASFPGLRQNYEKRFGDYYSCGVTNYKKLKSVFEEECKATGISTKMPSYQSRVSSFQLSFLGGE